MTNLSKKKEIISTALLLITALCWGTSFTARKIGLLYITPLFFNGLRFLLGFVFIVIIYVIFQKGKLDPTISESGMKLHSLKAQILGGTCMGIVLGLGGLFQQLALVSGTAGKTAFFTALYTIMVPIISAVFLKTKVQPKVWIGAVVAVIGIYLIGGAGNFSMSTSDILALLCALSFALQILIIGKFSPGSNGLFLSMIQALVAGLLNLILGLIFESGNSLEGIMNAFWPLMVSAFIAMALPYSLQIIAQKNVPPSIAAIVLSLESVFGAMFGAMILGERMSPVRLTGCALIFGAIVIAQINFKWKKGDEQETRLP